MIGITTPPSAFGGLGGWGHMTGEMTLFGWIVMALFLFLVVWVVWSLAADRHTSRRRPMDLLDARYARGEIDRERYLESKNDLALKTDGAGRVAKGTTTTHRQHEH